MNMNSNEFNLNEIQDRTKEISIEKPNRNQNNKLSRFNIIILIIAASAILAMIILICVYLLIKKKDEQKQSETSKPEEYYILGTYNAKKGVPLKLFNPSKIGLDDKNYTIKQQISNNTMRRLKEIIATDGVIIPETTGVIQIQIIFDQSLNSLDFLFERCTDLIKVDLTNLNSPSITSMIYTFTDCSNLETADLTSFNSSRVEKMEFLFGGCTHLVNLKGFENLNTSSLKKTAGMFIGCHNLQKVNLSSFQLDNISEQNGMFIDNPSLETLDIGNTSDINTIFSSSENFNVKIITTSNELNTSGLSGEFTTVNRDEIQILNCTKRNWTDLLVKLEADVEMYNFIFNNYYYYANEILNNTDNFYFTQDIYDYLKQIKYINCYENNDYNETLNISFCEKERRFFIDLLNEFEKCAECATEEERRMYCQNCSRGYYVPKGIDYEPTKCRKCDEGCIDCIPDNETDASICLRCENENSDYDYEDYDDYDYDEDYYYYSANKYRLYKGKCMKKCVRGSRDRCKSCSKEDGKYDQCSSCNPGYYFDENYNTSKCKKIEIENCIEAVVESGTVRCTNCSNGYIVHDNKCVKACNFGYWGYSCASCNTTYEFRENCASCHSGYYLAPFDNKTICENCHYSLNYENSYLCKECEYQSGEVKCIECKNNYFIHEGRCMESCPGTCSNCTYENGNKICNECIDGYYLKNLEYGNTCEKCPEGCKACTSEYNCTQCMDGYKSIQVNETPEDSNFPFPIYITYDCEKYCVIGNDYKCKSCDFNKKDKCKECNTGYYLPNDVVDKSKCYRCSYDCISCYGDWYDPICTKCSSGYYLPIGYNKRYCNYCGSDRIKECHQADNYTIIIDKCNSGYLLLRNTCVEKCDTKNPLSRCLVCNEAPDKLDQCKQCKEGYYLPIDYDNTYCYFCPYPCTSCHGTYSNPNCTSCYDGYILSGGKCLQNCTIGNDNLCKSCNTEPGKIDKCLECNEKYYLAEIGSDYYLNNYDQKFCLSCPDNCKKCKGKYGYKADCTECETGYYLVQIEENQYDYYYNPTYYHICNPCNIPGCLKYKSDSNSCICIECNTPAEQRKKYNDLDNEYISCYIGCDNVELEKCKSCGTIAGKCGECNVGYTLNSEGKCLLEDFHMYAKYRTTTKNEFVKFMSYTTIIKMIIDGEEINNPSNYHNFPSPGEHLVLIKFSNSVSFMDLFYGITHLIYIEFLPKAKSLYISLMNDCFCGCTNLEYAFLNNLNLKSNKCFMNFFRGDKKLKEVKFPSEPFNNIIWFYNMFYGCESLTSIDMSNVGNTHGEYFYQMFYGCINLRSIDLSGFNKAYKGYFKYDMFINVPKEAEIKIHINFFNSVSYQLTSFKNITTD